MADIASTIVAVTAFTDRARVTRRCQVTLEPGAQRIVLKDLPASLDPASLRVAARGTVPLKLLGVDSRKTYSAETTVIRVRELEVRMQALADDETADADAASSLAKQLVHLDGLADATRIYAYGLANGKTTLDQQAAFLAFYERQRSRVNEQSRAIAQARRDRGRLIAQLHHELNLVRIARPREGYTVAVEVKLEAAGEIEVDVVYVLPDAHWKPLYDVRLRGEELEVSYLAEVQQNTGEDWSGVTLTLSTARPAFAATLPQLTPWLLYSRLQAPPSQTRSAAALSANWMTMAASSGVSRLESMSAPSAMMADAEVEVAQVEQSGGTVTFQIPGSIDVPSDNTPHKSTIGIFRLRPHFDYVCVPKLAAVIYRRITVANTSAYTLLPGPAQLFLNDDYLGATHIPQTALGQVLKLFFGTDDRLRVERTLSKRDVAKSFLGSRRKLHYAYSIRLWNHTETAQKFTVVDQIPLGQHEDIKVTVDAVEPKPDRQDELNIVVWKLSIEANGEKAIAYSFTVDHPREMAVSGLA